MPNFHDHRGVVDNGLNDGLDFLKDIVRQAKEIDPEIEYTFVLSRSSIEAANYVRESSFHASIQPAKKKRNNIVYCHNTWTNLPPEEQDGICNRAGFSFYEIKLALCLLLVKNGHKEMLTAVLQHASGQHECKHWNILIKVA